jgi:hypothetical protein
MPVLKVLFEFVNNRRFKRQSVVRTIKADHCEPRIMSGAGAGVQSILK